jgi:hypothetical protein
MILRPLAAPAHQASGAVPEPIWVAIERAQRQDFSAGCWLVPQPAHAALAADIAKQLDPKAFPGITPEIVRGIALHDSGWSPEDANTIQESRARGARYHPASFITAPPRDTLAAWIGSIEIAGKGSPLGGYLVSRHFSSIAETYKAQAEPQVATLLTSFIAQEDLRRAKLRKKLNQTEAELHRWVEALQFCDLLSLYLSSGLQGEVSFPQKIGTRTIGLQGGVDRISLTPSPFAGATSFSLAAMRHPKTTETSSAVFAVYVDE